MKKVLFVLIVCLVGNFVQAQEILDTITDETCKCLGEKDLKEADRATVEQELAMCFIQIAPKYLKEIKDEMGIDILGGEEEGRKLGEQIGINLVATCPIFMELMGVFVEDELAGDTEESSSSVIEGKLLKIENEQFTSLIIKENGTGRETRVYWLPYFENSEMLIKDGKKQVGKQVIIQYEELEVYQPKLKDYSKIKVIFSMEME